MACHGVCRAVNVPSKLLACLEVQQSVHGRRPLLIQISTDQVCTQQGRRADLAALRSVWAPYAHDET